MQGKFLKKTAIITGVSLALVFFWKVPLVGAAGLFISVAPQLIALRKGRIAEALVSWAVLLAILYFIVGGTVSALYAVLFVGYGLWYRKVLLISDNPAGRIITAAAGWVFLVAAAAAGLYYLKGVNIMEQLFIALRSSGGNLSAVYIDAGLPHMENYIANIISLFLRAFAGATASIALAGSLFVYLVLCRYGKEYPAVAVENFRMPDEMIWVLLGGALFFVAGSRLGVGGIFETAGINIGLLMLVLYFASGISLSLFFMKQWNFSPFIRIVLIFVVLFFSGGIYLFTAAGIADVWLDFRKKRDMQES